MSGNSDNRKRGCVVVFDLDDTLFPEADYAHSGFAAVGRWLEATQGIKGFGPLAQEAFDKGVRGTIFNAALDTLGVECTPGLLSGMISVYRNHRPDIRLDPRVRDLLADLSKSAYLAIITDGWLAGQRAKVEALGLDRLIDKVICTDQWGRDAWKPAPRSYEEIEKAYPVSAPSLYAYVGDNPSKDFFVPRRKGWRTLQVTYYTDRTPDPATPEYHAAAKIGSLAALPEALRRMGMPL